MAGNAFFDTNVLVYLIGHDDRRTPITEDLLAAGGVISVQVLNELVAVARRKLRMSWGDVENSLEAIEALCPSPAVLSVDTHQSARKIAKRYDFHIYDALVIASALEAECETLYSEDLQDGQVISSRLTVRNPFKEHG